MTTMTTPAQGVDNLFHDPAATIAALVAQYVRLTEPVGTAFDLLAPVADMPGDQDDGGSDTRVQPEYTGMFFRALRNLGRDPDVLDFNDYVDFVILPALFAGPDILDHPELTAAATIASAVVCS